MDGDDLIGKRVTVLPSLVCGECYNCRTGRFNICDTLRVIGCQTPGAFAEYVKAPRDKVFVLPDSISWEQAILVEPLAVAVHAVRKARNIAGRNVVVLGAGTIGLMVANVLKAYGAGNIIISDFNDKRLTLARKLGANTAINVASDLFEEIVSAQDFRIDTVFECAGVESTINQGIDIVEKGGEIVILGVFEDEIKVKMGLVQDKEINLQGVLMYDKEDYYEALRLVETNNLITEMITHRFSLHEISEAFDSIESDSANAIKILLEVS